MRCGWARNVVPNNPSPRLVVVIVVWRRTHDGVEWLVLHRSHFAPQFGGDWAWTPPSGVLDEGESEAGGAWRELREETGLEQACVRTPCGDGAIVVFHAEVDRDAEVRLSAEHDAYRWLPLDEARALCLPAYVGDQLACVAALAG